MTLTPGVSPEAVEELSEALNEPEPAPKKGLTGKSTTQIAFSRLRKDKMAVVCSTIIAILVLAAIFAPLICKAMGIYHDAEDPNAPSPSKVLDVFGDQMPLVGPPDHGFTIHHPLGIAPQTGLDNFAVLLYGLRASLLVATCATVATTIMGVVVGLIAGFSRGWLDRFLAFVIDLFLSFPYILGAIAIAPIVVSHFRNNEHALARAQVIALIAILTIFGWMSLARLIRGQVLSLREREFIQAAQVIGVPTRQILFKELLPNLVAPLVVSVSLSLPTFVAAEASLSYLGIGLHTSLGQVVDSATTYWQVYPLYLWSPVLLITIIVLTLNLLGDSVRDAFDPKTRR